MNQRTLGKSQLEVSAIGLGCMGMSSGFGPPGEKQAMIAVIRAVSIPLAGEDGEDPSSGSCPAGAAFQWRAGPDHLAWARCR